MWGDNGISVHDIRQGAVGNCWFLAAASAMAEEPARLESMFVDWDVGSTNGISNNGIYTLKFYALMMPVYVTIDDKIPFRKGRNQALYARVGEDKSVWAPLLEKGFAEYHGTYEALHGGWMDAAMRTLAGTPGKNINHGNWNKGIDKFFQKLAKFDADKTMMTTACFNSWNGLVGGHAYTVLKLVELTKDIRLVQVRNPWGRGEFKGDWSDKSPLWTDEFKAKAGFENKPDGAFFIDIKTYKQRFAVTQINYST